MGAIPWGFESPPRYWKSRKPLGVCGSWLGTAEVCRLCRNYAIDLFVLDRPTRPLVEASEQCLSLLDNVNKDPIVEDEFGVNQA